MRATLEASRPVEQVADIAGRYGAVQVRARCYAIPATGGPRYEVLLESGAERAVVDVPGGADLPTIVRHAMEVFADSMAARV